MDEKYFLEKMHDVLVEIGEPETAIWLGLLPILKQIAHDAKVEQARVDGWAVSKLKDFPFTLHPVLYSEEEVAGDVIGAAITALAAVSPKNNNTGHNNDR